LEDERNWAGINTHLRRQAGQQEVSRKAVKPVHRTWEADYILREGQSRLEQKKWLKDSKLNLQKRRWLLQVLTNSFPCGAVLHKMGKLDSDKCRICPEEARCIGAQGNASKRDSQEHPKC